MLLFKKYLPYSVAILLCLTLHFYQQSASIEGLLWLVQPVVTLLSWMTGIVFTYQTDIGFIAETSDFAITKTCSGVNFLMLVFGMSVFMLLGRFEELRQQWIALLGFGLGAYGFAILVNTFRLLISIQALQLGSRWSVLATNSVHQAIGITFFLFFLVVYYGVLNYGISVFRSQESGVRSN